jgi:hypothetical protein
VAKKSGEKKQAIKASDKKQTIKTNDNMRKVTEYLKENGESRTSDIAEYIGLSQARTRVILRSMGDVAALGENRNRTYMLK